MTKDDAERVIRAPGPWGTETEEASETVVAGTVISQSVKAKSEAKAETPSVSRFRRDRTSPRSACRCPA
ncbi:MAG: hypothetical protein ACLTMP_00630 [Eggerthella lenta]